MRWKLSRNGAWSCSPIPSPPFFLPPPPFGVDGRSIQARRGIPPSLSAAVFSFLSPPDPRHAFVIDGIEEEGLSACSSPVNSARYSKVIFVAELSPAIDEEKCHSFFAPVPRLPKSGFPFFNPSSPSSSFKEKVLAPLCVLCRRLGRYSRPLRV